jgi:hypothetical protein
VPDSVMIALLYCVGVSVIVPFVKPVNAAMP